MMKYYLYHTITRDIDLVFDNLRDAQKALEDYGIAYAVIVSEETEDTDLKIVNYSSEIVVDQNKVDQREEENRG